MNEERGLDDGALDEEDRYSTVMRKGMWTKTNELKMKKNSVLNRLHLRNEMKKKKKSEIKLNYEHIFSLTFFVWLSL